MSSIQVARPLSLIIRTTVQNLPRRQCRFLSSKNKLQAPPMQESSIPQHKFTRKHERRSPPLADNVAQILNGTKEGKVTPRYLAYEIERLMKECSALSSRKGNFNTVKLMHKLLEEKVLVNQVVLEEMKKDYIHWYLKMEAQS